MILLAPAELVPGQVVARDVFNPAMPQMVLLKAGHRLTSKTINALHRFHSEGIWVVDDNLAPVSALVAEEVERTLNELAVQSFALWTSMERDPFAELPVKAFEIMVEDAVQLLRRINLSLFTWTAWQAGDIFFGSHPAYVCVLSLILQRRAEQYVEKEFPGEAMSWRIATLLGMGALLHDIGNLRVPRHLLMNPDTLTPSELEEVRSHVEHGYRMLHHVVGPHPALIALHHHQAYDGSGYPCRRSGEDDKPLAGHRIPVIARIVSIADTYVTLTAHRPYADAAPSLSAFRHIAGNAGAAFDPVLVSAFMDAVPPFLPGRRVELSNGYNAVVVGYSPGQPEKPIVRTVINPNGEWLPVNRREDLALSLHGDIRIVSYQDVPLAQATFPDKPPHSERVDYAAGDGA